MTTAPSNTDDLIDSRDIIKRIEELEAVFTAEEISEANGARPQPDDSGEPQMDATTCGECGRAWNDALITDRTPAPSARCPYESIHDELAELDALRTLAEQCEGYAADWRHGETLIRDSYFQDYAEQLADDLGAIDAKAGWPNNCIDWQRAARELQMDYTAVDFDGVTYWIR